VVLASAETTSQAAIDKATFYFQQQGKKCCRSPTIPACWCGGRWRCWLTKRWTRCKRVASAEDIDTAMRLGVNYPRGPLAWGESLGWGRVLRLLENLQQHYGEERYRPCSLLRQKALMERHHEQ
jgi:3-hydroxybutyryl-CoA dehydrogenase